MKNSEHTNNRKKGAIIIYSIVILLLLMIAVALFTYSTEEKTIKEISYAESSNIDYKVYLKENEFFENNYLGKDNQYIASLIDYIQANFKYELSSPDKNVDYKYEYRMVAKVSVADDKTKNALYEIEESLLDKQTYSANTNKNLVINQPVRIDYHKFNDIVSKFVELYDLDNINATLTVNMYVDLIDDVTSIEQAKESTVPVMILNIPLTTKTMAIDIESKTVNANTVSKSNSMQNRGNIFIAIIILMVDFVIVRRLFVFINDTKDEESAYNAKLRKLMISYGSYVQKLSSKFDFTKYQIVDIKLFEDLLQIRETINRPILMSEEEEATDTYFFIPTEDTVYIYEIKPGTFRNKMEKQKNKEEKDETLV